MYILIYKNGSLIDTVRDMRDAAIKVASLESISNIYAVELKIINCILLNQKLKEYEFKLKED